MVKMSDKYILYLYSATAFQQEVLPAINNSDYVIRLSAEQFRLQQDVRLTLEVIENKWFLNWEKEKHYLYCNEFIKIRLASGEILSLITRIESAVFCVSRKYELPTDQPVTIGSGDGNLIRCDAFRLISSSHAVISFIGKEYCIADKGKNGIYINGKRLTEQKTLYFGDCIDLFGLRMVFLRDALAIPDYEDSEEITVRVLLHSYDRNQDTDMAIYKAETVFFHRGPRRGLTEGPSEFGAGDASKEIAIEAPAARHDPERQSLLLSMGPAFTFALPMIISVLAGNRLGGFSGSFLYMGLFMTVSTAFLGVFWGIIHWMFQKKSRKWEEKRRRIVYKNYLEEVEGFIEKEYRNERKMLLEKYPVCSRPLAWEEIKKRLWSRNFVQADFLCQRVGLGEIPFSTRIIVTKQAVAMIRDELKEGPERIRRRYEKLKEVPVCVDLSRNGLIGLVGGRGKRGAVRTATLLLLQIAVNNCYTDVKVALLYNEENGEMNRLANVVKWLPHIWSDDRGMRYLAGNRAEAGEVFYALGEICRNRMKKHFIIFLENQELLEGEGFGRYIFAEREGLRLTTVLLEEELEDMPNGCNIFIQDDRHYSGIIHHGRANGVTFDRISTSLAEELARGLTGIRVKENAAEGEIKGYVPFLSLFSGLRPEDMDILGKWRKSRIHESIRVPIGRKAGNRLLFLDIHEKYHGPHGLIAGTTGSGKSEVLQTYLLSLAIHFPPEDIAFFIIDYKGGGMGNWLAGLPHTVGVISNLSGNQVRRALISIKSENEMRQRQFHQYGISHINQYTVAYKNRKISECIPHLFIIVDEFAELKREEPEFMQELVSVAQVGRSLGIHLILSTQKPAGVVDEHIWSNARFRVCLRVQDRQDSMDMLHRPDAAELTGVGRCYLQVGNDEVFELFQAAFGGAAYTEDCEIENRACRLLTRTGRYAFDHDMSEGPGITQAEKTIEYLIKIGNEPGYRKGHSMWLPPLPRRLSLDEIKNDGAMPRQTGQCLCAIAGLCDYPAKQRQFPLSVDLCRQGNILICGGPATGKSTLLQTMLFSLMEHCASMEAVFFIIDCSSQMLRSFREMPHVAGMAGEEPDKWERIFYRLRQELRKRKERFAGGSFMHMSGRQGSRLSSDQENRIEEGNLPAAILVIDNYAGFRTLSKEKYDEIIVQLAAEGRNNGIFLMIAASGVGMSEVPGKLAGNFGYRLCLEMGDRYQYGEILRVSRPGVYPEEGIKGRGIVREEEGVLEFQTALVYGEGNDFIRSENIEEEAMEKRKQMLPYVAEPVPEIPETPDFDFFIKSLEERKKGGTISEREERDVLREKRIPIGYEQESGNIYEIQLREAGCFLITGRKGSGKSNLLRIICHMGNAEKAVYIDFTNKTGAALPPHVLSIHSELQLHHWLDELSTKIRKRCHKNPGGIIHQNDCDNFPDSIVVIDDLHDFLIRVYHPEEGAAAMGGLVEYIWENDSGHGNYWFAAWNQEMESDAIMYSGFRIFTGYGQGMHLGGNTAAQRFFSFEDLSYGEQNKSLKPGIALIPPQENSGTKKIIIPLIR